MISGALAMVAYFILFAIVHSLLADPGFKSQGKSMLVKAFDRWQKLIYNLLALLMMLPFLFILAFLPDKALCMIPTPWSWLMVCGQLLAVAALLITLRQTGISYFLGLSQLRDLSGQANGGMLVTDGFYCYIRNPLFFFAAVFLWLSPLMTWNLLVFNILVTLYFYLGARHEERSLKEVFGRVYEDCREKVPMFLPRLRCSG
jgi:methanethiol S-methyltransferase